MGKSDNALILNCYHHSFLFKIFRMLYLVLVVMYNIIFIFKLKNQPNL